jgi:hypothetical protein
MIEVGELEPFRATGDLQPPGRTLLSSPSRALCGRREYAGGISFEPIVRKG